MLPVYQIIVPTPYAVGPVNVYLIKDKPFTLIDVGPDTPKAEKALKEMLAALEVDTRDIERIIITHSHPDHSGLAARFASETGATVFVHTLEERKLSGKQDYIKERMQFVLETGIPAEVVQEIVSERDKLPRPTLEGVRLQKMIGCETLEFAGGELQVMHYPGHSPGHLCLYDSKQKFFFSGDFLLPHITPNPLMEPDLDRPGRRLPALKQYLAGLDVLEKLPVNMVLPGHGGVFNDCRGVIEVGRLHHRFQFERIKEKLRGKELNAYQLSKEIYPNLKGWEIFLGLSEVLAHLDLLVEWREIDCTNRQGVNYYTL